MSDITQIRYFFEHKFLPHIYYDPKIILPVSIKQNPDVIRQNWKNILNKEQVQDIYPDDAWEVQSYELDPHTASNRIICPIPEKEPQCYYIYMLFTYDLKRFYYFTMEKGGLFDSGPFLCGWDPDGKHRNFGGCEQDIEKGLDRAFELFQSMPDSVQSPAKILQ